MQINRLDANFAVSPQIALSDVAEIAAAGFSVLINNRPDGEAADQPSSAAIEAEALRHGLRYWYIPVSPSGITQANLDMLADALRDAEGPALAYCRSGTRSGILWQAVQPNP